MCIWKKTLNLDFWRIVNTSSRLDGRSHKGKAKASRWYPLNMVTTWVLRTISYVSNKRHKSKENIKLENIKIKIIS